MKENLNYNNIDTFICPKCNGDGYVEIDEAPGYVKTCPLCEGKKVVDWIKKVTGYSRTEYTEYSNNTFWNTKKAVVWNAKGVSKK